MTHATELVDLTRSQYALPALDALFHRLVFRVSDFAELSSIPRQSAFPLIRRLREADILRTVREPSGRRPAIFAFPALMNI